MSGFEAFVRAAHGAAGAAWLERLPAVVAACVERWGLVAGARFAADYSWVAEARRADGTPLVLKLSPDWEGLRDEASALALLGGRGAVELLDADPGWGEGFARHRAAHGGGTGPLDPAQFARAEAVSPTCAPPRRRRSCCTATSMRNPHPQLLER